MLVAEVAAAEGAEGAAGAEAAPEDELAPPKMLVAGAVEAALPALAPNMKMPPLGSAASEAEPLAPPKMLPELLGAESKMLAAGFASSPSEAGFAALKRPSVSV